MFEDTNCIYFVSIGRQGKFIIMAKGKMIEFQVHLKTEENFQKVLTDEENLWGKLVSKIVMTCTVQSQFTLHQSIFCQ